MKKLLLLITALFILASVEGQILRYSNYVAPIPTEILVISIDVFGTGGATTISTNGGTLQMLKKTLPTNASDTSATWSRNNGTGTANISAGGLLTALTNGTVTVISTANDGSAVYGTEVITISNQAAPEMIANGTFDTDISGWTPFDGNITVSAGVLNVPRAGTWFAQLEDDMAVGPLELSTDYRLMFDIVAPDGAVTIRIMEAGNSDILVANGNYSTGTITLDFTTPSSWTYAGTDKGIRFVITYSEACTIDNISLKER